jgi:hypothetical protein
MSYDLFLKGLPSEDTLREWFDGRRNYQLKETQAFYENETTGVYFSFDFREGSLAFNLNYYRPSFFGLEAEIEVTALVDEFKPKIDDPQSEGMGEGPYSPEGFLRGWNAGNRFAHQAIGPRDSQPKLTLPTQTLHDVWRWNYAREDYQERLGTVDMVTSYVPTIWFLTRPSEPQRVITAAVWGEAMPFAMPELDALLIVGPSLKLLWRKDLALDGYPRGKEQFSLDGKNYRLPAHRLLDYETPPADLLKTIEARSFADEKPTRLAPDSLHDRELVA